MPHLSHRFWLAWQVGRHLGPKWLCQRATWALQQRAFWWQLRTPSRPWHAYSTAELWNSPQYAASDYWSAARDDRPRLFPGASEWAGVFWSDWDGATCKSAHPATEADGLKAGSVRYFGHNVYPIGCPPDWHQNPITSQRLPADRHWSQISDSAHGDIKMVWEASRFGWAYPLVRAYARSTAAKMDAEPYSELFWQWFEDWCARNPPYQGANWKCGQEISLRMMAWVFAYHGLAASSASTPERRYQLVRALGVGARRVAAHIDYALSQQNNHGISEAVGLWTVGQFFPELRYAPQWEQRGREILEQLARTLIYDDGSFSQHSWNYHRVMLQLYTWVLCLSRHTTAPFSSTLTSRVGRAAELLYQVVDLESGEPPVYGQNDGALVLPLTNCNRQDFRPALQAAAYATRGENWFSTGPWDEERFWLSGSPQPRAIDRRPEQSNILSETGGYVMLRAPQLAVHSRCGGLRHRPSQADQLHVDVRWRGVPIAIDAGTFSYNAPPPWNNPLASTQYHNTITVDGRDQMLRAGRFLWLPWIEGNTIAPQTDATGSLTYWRGSHDGYQRLGLSVRYQREVLLLGQQCCVVVDRLHSDTAHQYRLHWLIADMPYTWHVTENRLELDTDEGRYQVQLQVFPRGMQADVVRQDPDSPRGWRSRYYQQREAAISLACVIQAQSAAMFSVFAPGDCRIALEPVRIQLDAADGCGTVDFQWDNSDTVMTHAEWQAGPDHSAQLDLSIHPAAGTADKAR